MENKFKKGLILGGLLAVGAAIGFAMTQEGQELTEELQKDLKTLAKHLKKNLSQLDDVTKENFNESVAAVVEEYAKKKELAGDAKKALITALQAKWHEMEEEYLAEKDEEKIKK
jgi:BMFP domain-containing protein YqiC